MGAQNLHKSGRTSLVLLFSSLWAAHPASMGLDFNMIASLLPSHCGFFFVFGHGASFFDGLQCPPIHGCSTVGCDFGALTGGDECMSFYAIILNQISQLVFILYIHLFPFTI